MALITEKERGEASRTLRQHTSNHQITPRAISHVRLGRAHRERSQTRLADAWGSARGVRGGQEASTAGRSDDSQHGVLRQESCRRNKRETKELVPAATVYLLADRPICQGADLQVSALSATIREINAHCDQALAARYTNTTMVPLHA